MSFSPSAGMMQDHFLSLPRITPGHHSSSPSMAASSGFDISTLHAPDFDVDPKTGFMPRAPLTRFRAPSSWAIVEDTLDKARALRLQLSTTASPVQAEVSEGWRKLVISWPELSIDEISDSEFALRRAHMTLTFVLHLYMHTLPEKAALIVPRQLATPLLQVSAQLQIPPVNNYADTVLWNWQYTYPERNQDSENEMEDLFRTPRLPEENSISSEVLYTGTSDEEHFFLTSARIELRGAEALTLMRSMLDEMFVGDSLARSRLTRLLHEMAITLAECAVIMRDVRSRCDPKVFYDDIRPWFAVGPWHFEGSDQQFEGLAGASAVQSSFVPAVDAFLGIPTAEVTLKFRDYMPRHHRRFLLHLREHPSIREYILDNAEDHALSKAYDDAVNGLKLFRDAHMEAARVYIIAPARRARMLAAGLPADPDNIPGSGGTDLVKFLNQLRQTTHDAKISRV